MNESVPLKQVYKKKGGGEEEMAFAEIQLKLPADRAESAKWILQQSPDRVADVLLASEAVHKCLQSVHSGKVLEEAEERHAAAVAELTRLHEEELKGEREVARSNMIRAQNAAEETRQARERAAKDREELWAHNKTVLHEMSASHRSAIELLSKQASAMAESVKAKDDQLCQLTKKQREATELYAEQIHKLTSSFAGKPSSVGQLGEEVVRNTLHALGLGEYHDDSHKKTPGYADGTWIYQPADAKKRLVALVEVKNASADTSTCLLSTSKDIAKFLEDVRAASARVSMAMLISLNKRIPNKDRITLSMETGVFTVWASRDASDSLPAVTLVEMAFRVAAETWRILSSLRPSEEDQSSLLASLKAHIDGQITRFLSIDKQIDRMVDSANSQLRAAKEMKAVQVQMLSSAQAVLLKLPHGDGGGADDDFWQEEGGKRLLAAVLDWKGSKGGGTRYPQKASDVNHLVGAVGDECFAEAVRRAKVDEAAKRKRKKEPC